MALRAVVFGRAEWKARSVLREAFIGYSWEWCEEASADEIVRRARHRDVDLIVIGTAGAPADEGLSLAREVRRIDPTCAIVIFGSDRSQEFAVEALRAGVTDLLGDDASGDAVGAALERIAGRPRGDREEERTTLIGGSRLVGRSRAAEQTRLEIRRVAASDANVLITGETGTGKELIADLVHRNSARARKPLVCINCAAIPDSLVESELFGYERGAFTGAHTTTIGKLEAANGGTVFFDEIGEMSHYAQAKILRVIESKQIQRLGSPRSTPVNFRVVAATHRDLDNLAMTDDGFRKDLYFRINVGRIHLPPLRDRRADIPPLIDHYVAELNQAFARDVIGFESATLEHLVKYDWPGNVRELRNVLESIFVGCPAARIEFSDLPQWLRNRLQSIDPNKLLGEQDRILDALLATNWNKSQAAQKLHWSRMTLYRKLAKYGLDTRDV